MVVVVRLLGCDQVPEVGLQRSRVRLMTDSLKMFANLFMVRWKDLQGKYN